MGHAHADSADKRKRWRARNPQKDAAHRAVENLVRRWKRAGQAKPACSCGAPSAHAHHTDYSRPLDVVWQCATCHISGHWSAPHGWREQRAAYRAGTAA